MSRRIREGVIMGENHMAILPNARAVYSAALMDSLMAEAPVEENPRERIRNRVYAPASYYTDEAYTGEYFTIGGYRITPNGPDNLFPYHFKKLIDSNDKLNSMLRQKIDLMLAGGLYLYQEVKDGNKVVREDLLDDEIEDWLESWGHFNYILQQVTDFTYIENNYTLMICNVAAGNKGLQALGIRPLISSLQYLPSEDMRMEALDVLQHRPPQYFFRADWLRAMEVLRYNAYDRRDPFRSNTSVFFTHMPTFGSKAYGRPPFIGIVNYLELKALILNWQKDNLKNTQFKWHIESPFDFWETVARHKNWDIAGPEMRKYEEELLAQIDQFLQSETAENAQKRFHSKFGRTQFGNEFVSGWKITALEDNTLKNSEAYIKAGEQIDASIIASVHLDPALSNVQQQGKLSSGLDKLIAFNIHQLTATPTPRRLILEPINEALRVNFWREGYRPRLGMRELQMSYQEKGAGAVKDTKAGEGQQ
jgi:hypothetical protein